MNWLVERIRSRGEQIAVIFDDHEYSYSALYFQICKYYDEIQSRVKQGSVVAIISDYSFYSIALFFALYENRNVIVPITTTLKSEIDDRIKVANCNNFIYLSDGTFSIEEVIINGNQSNWVEELVQKNAAGLILFSSGSTGAPKAMIHNLDTLIDSYNGKKGKNLIFLIFLMFDHIGGLNTLLNCLSMGVTMVFPSKRDPELVASLIEKYKVNILPASPTFLNLMLISDSCMQFDLSSLRMITYGTEPMPESLLLKLKEVFPRVKFLQTFGTSETGIAQISSKSSTSTYIKIDDPNTEHKIVGGELWIKSKTQIMGYLNSTMDRFTDDGWFKTGDLVEENDDGYIKIVGRNKELINVGGEKVLPSEVESVLFQLSDISDCIVYGEPNPITGQMVVAKVLFSGENLKVSEVKKRIVQFCSDKLDRYKIPAKIVLMDESEFSERFKKRRINN